MASKSGFKISAKSVAREMLQAAAVHIFWAVFSFIASRGNVIGLAPFGLGVVAGVDLRFVPAAAVGSALGYLVPSTGQSAFIYFAALCSVAALRLTIGTIDSMVIKPFWNFIIGFGTTFIVWISAYSLGNETIISALGQGVLTGLTAFLIASVCKTVNTEPDGLNDEEFASASFCINILLLPLFSFMISELSVGKIAAVVLVLIISRHTGVSRGVVFGVMISLFVIMSSKNIGVSVLIYPIGAAVNGMISKKGKIIGALSFNACALLSLILTDNVTQAVATIIEGLFGAAIFLAIPDKIGFKIGSFFALPIDKDVPLGLKGALLMRLRDASSVLSDVSRTVEKVAGELSRINTPEHGDVINKIEASACTGCRLHDSCWNASRDKTLEAVGIMGACVSSGGISAEMEMPAELKERCIRREKVETAVYATYFDFLSRLDAESRIKDVRDVICDQFEGISYMLGEISDDLSGGEKYDTKAATALSAALKNIGLMAVECGCKTDRFGRMSVEVRVRKASGVKLNRMRILNVACSVLEREFEPPIINGNGDDIMIHLGEKPDYTVVSGVAQINSAGATVCGDAYNCFEDSKGRFIILLSDGMGTGGRAAVDSAMASGLMSQLIKAGFGFESALKILNSSMLFKSTDESLATVDIACIDLFSGHTTLLKAGAAPTVVVRSGKVARAESSSLPAGILRDTAFDRADISVKEGDILVMMSDGAVTGGTDWICNEIKNFDGDVQALAEHIAQKAVLLRDDGHADDITVIVSSLQKAV